MNKNGIRIAAVSNYEEMHTVMDRLDKRLSAMRADIGRRDIENLYLYDNVNTAIVASKLLRMALRDTLAEVEAMEATRG